MKKFLLILFAGMQLSAFAQFQNLPRFREEKMYTGKDSINFIYDHTEFVDNNWKPNTTKTIRFNVARNRYISTNYTSRDAKNNYEISNVDIDTTTNDTLNYSFRMNTNTGYIFEMRNKKDNIYQPIQKTMVTEYGKDSVYSSTYVFTNKWVKTYASNNYYKYKGKYTSEVIIDSKDTNGFGNRVKFEHVFNDTILQKINIYNFDIASNQWILSTTNNIFYFDKNGSSVDTNYYNGKPSYAMYNFYGPQRMYLGMQQNFFNQDTQKWEVFSFAKYTYNKNNYPIEIYRKNDKLYLKTKIYYPEELKITKTSENIAANVITVSPIPAKEKIDIHKSNDSIVINEYLLRDVNGSLIKKTSGMALSIDTSMLAPGLYFLETVTDQGNTITKILID